VESLHVGIELGLRISFIRDIKYAKLDRSTLIKS